MLVRLTPEYGSTDCWKISHVVMALILPAFPHPKPLSPLAMMKGQHHQADIVVLAAGTGLSSLWEGRLEPMLPITANCGQVSHIPSIQGVSGGRYNYPVGFGGYLARARDGRYALGASYQRMENAHITGQIDQISPDAHADNYARLPESLQNRIPYVPSMAGAAKCAGNNTGSTAHCR